MPGVLFGIPLTEWIYGTIEKMNRFGKQDIQSWGIYWFETYKELSGQSNSSGNKECPQHAAYGLWRLGRIKNTNISHKPIPISIVNQEYGKNAAYAVLTIDLFEKRLASKNNASLWIQVQNLYRQTVHIEPAKSQQGAVTVAATLFKERKIIMDTEQT